MSVELLAKLSEPFAIDEVKQRRQGGTMLDYISIDATIRRLNETLGAEWSTSDLSTSIIPIEGGKYVATVAITLTAIGKQAVGVGADVAADPDKAVKTALAEALKKACHQYGVGLYLWKEEERAIVAIQRQQREQQPKDRATANEILQADYEAAQLSSTIGDGSF